MARRCRIAAHAGDRRRDPEGAQAYLRRQYTTIAVVGIVVSSLSASPGLRVGDRFRDRRRAVRRGRLHRHERVGARQRADRAGRHASLAAGLDVAFKAGAITGMLVAGLALLGVAGYYSC